MSERKTDRKIVVEWTPETVEMLKSMWKAGFSASKIVTAIGNGCTRNAVIGKIGRMGMFGRTDAPSKPKREPKAAPDRIVFLKSVSPVPMPPLPPVVIVCEPVTLMDRGDHQCRCIVRYDDGLALYCGAPRAIPSPYCASHRADLTRTLPPRLRAPIPRPASKSALLHYR